jgi:hypothetical protein
MDANVAGYSTRGRARAHYAQAPFVSALTDPILDRHVVALADRFAKDARDAGTDIRTLEVQFRLHVPSVPALVDEVAADVYEEIRTTVVGRAAHISYSRKEAKDQADNYNLSGEFIVKGDDVHREGGPFLPLEFRQVLPSIGMRYQRDIHYMNSQRADTVFHFGAFEPGTTYPLLYLAFSASDRPHLDDLLHPSGESIKDALPAVVLTRAVGITDLPYNLISRTLSKARSFLSQFGSGQLFTAYNPYLGFDGASFKAANFREIALAPVRYKYGPSGFVAGRIGSDSSTVGAQRETPRNVLMALGLDKSSRLILNKWSEIKDIKERIAIGNDIGSSAESALAELLPEFRELLEQGWSSRTVHPDFAGSPFGSPKGQCGVSSVWLAREIRHRFRLDATYCYGRLSSRTGQFDDVDRHCWIEIGPSNSENRLVIDLTADQAEGFNERIVHEEWAALSGRGVRYEARMRRSLDELILDAVWPRFIALSDALSEKLAA